MRSLTGLLIFGTMILAGCSLGAPGYLDDYATVGGKWQRSDPTYGRVGSVFSDPNSTVTDSNLAEFTEGGYSQEFSDADLRDAEVIDPGYEVDHYQTPYGPDDTILEQTSDSSEFDDGVIILGEDW